MSPLGAILMPALDITAGQFGVAVSAYAFSAGISGILAAGFADRFDRKRLLLFFYVGFTLGNAALRAGAELSCASARPDRDRTVRRRDRLRGARHHHRSVSAAPARPRDGFRANRLRRQPGARHSGRAFSRQPLELARLFRRDRRPVDRRDGRDPVRDAAGERASPTEAGQQRVPAPDRDHRTAALYAGFRGDDAAVDRRLHADAVRQRLHRA